MDILKSDFNGRVRAAISVAWDAFSRKVGGGVVDVNKEASMQLHFAHLLSQLVPLVVQQADESVKIELETGVNVEGASAEIDVLVTGMKGTQLHRIAVELKCYRTKAASGKNRGATDIFMKDVYEDLHILERYCEEQHADAGVLLVMNDREAFVKPDKKTSKCWDYDISDGATVGPAELTTQVGSKKNPIHVILRKKYTFSWDSHGSFWFSELEGECVQA